MGDAAELDRIRKWHASPGPNRLWSPSGDMPKLVVPEAGVMPLRAIQQILYGAAQVAKPGQVFTPVSAAERRDLLRGEFPAAKELG